MATNTTIYCGSPGNTADGTWYRSGALNWYDCLAAASDSQSARINNYTGSGDDGRNFASWGISGIPLYVVINSLTYGVQAARSGTGAGTMKFGWHLGGTVSWSSNFTPVSVGTPWTGSMARPGGGSWTRSDLSSLNARIYGNGDATQSRELIVDQIYVVVNWDYITLLSLVANAATSVTQTAATISGSYNANGDGDTEWRMVYGTSSGAYDSPSWTSASGSTGSITAPSRSLSSLTANTTYYYRLEARNQGDISYVSTEQTFTTQAATAGGLILFF
jgi:hypothetical protein